jgi:zinc protease
MIMGAIALFCIENSMAGIALQHWRQNSGAEVFLLPSPALAMVDVQVDFDAGSGRDPPEQAGLAGAAALMMGKGVRADGAPALDENALGEAWADLGASFSASASPDRLSFSLRSLTYPELLGQAVALAQRQMAAPAFAPAVWQRERQSLVASLNEADTRAATHATRAFNRAVYGDHPYGVEVTAQSLARVEVADLQAYHQRLLLPCRARVSVVGALDRVQADALVAQLLGGLPQPALCPPLAQLPEVQPLQRATVQWLPFAAAQAQVRVGQPGIRRDDPRFLALLVGNHILGGGGFGSRLTEQVREKRGLSYSVFSAFEPGRHAGAFGVALQTRPDQAAQAVHVVQQVLRDFVQQGPTEQELAAAKANLVGGFALRLDSNRKLLAQVANIAWNGLPLDYLDTWGQRVQALSRDEVHQAMVSVLQPDAMATVVVGGQPEPGL